MFMQETHGVSGKKLYPYVSTEIAFLSFIEDFKDFQEKKPNKIYLRDGPKDPMSGLRPREILGLIIMANLAMFLSGDVWVPGWLVAPDEKLLPEDIAHDGAIRCISGPREGKYMHIEQVMATEVANNASPEDIESAILREAKRKSSKGEKYVGNTALVIFVDYTGKLSNLRELSSNISESTYKAVYLIANLSEKLKDFVCVILKNPGDTLGPIKLEFNRSDGKPDIARLTE